MQDQLLEYQELALGSRLKRLSEQLMKDVSKIYESLHIDFDPYHMPIFKLISEQDELTIGEISDLLLVTQPAVTQYINILSKKGLVISKTGKIDKRKKKVSLSVKGERMLNILYPVWTVIDQEMKIITHNVKNKTLLDHIQYVENELTIEMFSSRVLSKINTK